MDNTPKTNVLYLPLTPLNSQNRIIMENILFIGGVGFQEILLIALVVLLFFGGKKIPELMKGLGQGVRSFKDGMNSVTDYDKDAKDETCKKTDEKKEE